MAARTASPARNGCSARALLDDVGLSDQPETIVSALPGGMRQRLALAGALLHRPQVVFLDEPTAGVDPQARRRFWRLIRKLSDEGTTVFVTTHYMDEAEYCGRVGLMVDGRLVAMDTPRSLKQSLVPGLLLMIRGHGLDAATIRQFPGVWEVEPFGAGLYARGDPDALDGSALLTMLWASGVVDAAVDPQPPTLEDVFLAVASPSRQGA